MIIISAYNYGPPQYGSYNRYNQSSGYGSYNPYGTVGYGGSMDRRGMRDGLYPDPYRRGGYEQEFISIFLKCILCLLFA